ncbi:MAG TPA: hypothetical protein VLE99_04535 [Candidatus Saccharimonadales bacterium]|nr:hypothetical protein [Candidatus Saccharimonadales bacterium]
MMQRFAHIEALDTIEPLPDYLACLAATVATPTEHDAARLAELDAEVTARTVLAYEGGRFQSHTVSDGLLVLVHAALSDERINDHDGTQPAARRSAAQDALVTLGSHVAVSGAFGLPLVRQAYGAIARSARTIGGVDKSFASQTVAMIHGGLFDNLDRLRRGDSTVSPIAPAVAIAAIEAAWSGDALGQPFRVAAPIPTQRVAI